jgi:putative molybdopterin biosynthesis protein
MTAYLTTKELAELLRIKERKVYELAANGEIPCSRAMGKLLFPRDEVEAWIASSSSGPTKGAARAPNRPNVVLGSHDPLLDWALRESRCGLASYFDGSLDGLDRFGRGEGIAVGLHLLDVDSDTWNVADIKQRFAAEPVVLVEWAWRQRGLIMARGDSADVKGLGDIRGRRVVPRQPAAGSQRLFEHLAAQIGVLDDIVALEPARTESDAALAVVESSADVAFGLQALADQYRLDFVPIVKERFDLMVDRRAWFEEQWQTFAAFWRSSAFAAKARSMLGYEVDSLGRVHFNGA